MNIQRKIIKLVKEFYAYWIAIIAIILLIYISPTSSSQSNQQENNTPNPSSNSITYIKSNSVICLSQDSFEKQVSLLSRHIMQYANGCVSTINNQRVLPIDISLLSGTCVVSRLSDNKKLWTTCESLE